MQMAALILKVDKSISISIPGQQMTAQTELRTDLWNQEPSIYQVILRATVVKYSMF